MAGDAELEAPLLNDDGEELTERERALIARIHAAEARGAERARLGLPGLAPEKQAFAPGMRPDGTLNEVVRDQP